VDKIAVGARGSAQQNYPNLVARHAKPAEQGTGVVRSGSAVQKSVVGDCMAKCGQVVLPLETPVEIVSSRKYVRG